MHELGTYLGRFHPLWVHLPIGILLLLGFLELAGLIGKRMAWSWLPALSERQRTLILAVGALASIVAALLGWILARTGDYDLTQVSRHQWLGIAACAMAVVLLAAHRVRWLYPPLLVGSLVLLAVAAHAGGQITHGTDYLTARMPEALARLLGVTTHPKPRIVSYDSVAAFPEVIQPILKERCVSCHGAAKSNGGLRVDSWDFLAKGGKHGAVLKPGNAAASELVRRIDLAVEDEGHMPPRGKPQLTDDDLTLIEWWVSAGAPRDIRIANLDLPSSVQVILEGRVAGEAEAPPDRAAMLAAAARISTNLGVLIRSVSPDGPWLDVNARVAGKGFDDTKLAQLAPIAGAIQSLDLGMTSVTDAGLASLEPMRRLHSLHLDGLKVSDAGLGHLSRLRQLVYLNLRGTQVTDQGMPKLRSLPRLRSLYVWQTAVTPGALQVLEGALVDQRRIARWKNDEADLERRIQEEHFEGNTGEELRPVSKPVTASAPTSAPAQPKLTP